MSLSKLRLDGDPFHIDTWMLAPDARGSTESLVSDKDTDRIIHFMTLGNCDRLTVARPGSRPHPEPGSVVDRAGFEAFTMAPVSKSESFWNFLSGSPVFLISFLKVHGLFAALSGVEGMSLIAKYLASSERLGGPQRCKFLFTLGSSQIVAFLAVRKWKDASRRVLGNLFLTGKDCPELLRHISDLHPAGIPNRLENKKQNKKIQLEHIPLLARTRTCLAWRSEDDRQNLKWSDLGPTDFTMAIDAGSGGELLVADKFKEEFHAGKNADADADMEAKPFFTFGTEDLHVPHLPAEELTEFLDKLYSFRTKLDVPAGPLTTNTIPLIPLETIANPPEMQHAAVTSSALQREMEKALSNLETASAELRGQASKDESESLNSIVRAAAVREIRDVLIAANGFLSDAELASDFLDTHYALRELVKLTCAAAKDPEGRDTWHRARQHAASLGAALHERARNMLREGAIAGPSFYSHAAGTHGYLKAWEIVMNLIFYNVLGESWPGCVVSTQEPGIWHDRTSPIIRVPLRRLHRPIPNLLRLSHEAGHLVFNLADAGSRQPPPRNSPHNNFIQIIGEIYDQTRWTYPKATALTLSSEIFATWFEYHAFRRDLDFALMSAWHSWLQSELPWENPGEVLLRTALIIAVDRLHNEETRVNELLRGPSMVPGSFSAKIIDDALDRVCNLDIAGEQIPKQLLEDCHKEKSAQRHALHYHTLPVLAAFVNGLPLLAEDTYNLQGIAKSTEAIPVLSSARKSILQGRVFAEPVPNWIALVFNLGKHYFEVDAAIEERSNLALTLSLAQLWDLHASIPVQVRSCHQE